MFLYSAATTPGIDTFCMDGTLADFFMSILHKNGILRQTVEALDVPKWISHDTHMVSKQPWSPFWEGPLPS